MYSKKLILFVIAFFSNAVLANIKNLDINFSTGCSVENPTATLSFVGDILIHQALYLDVVAETKHFSQIWERTNGLIQKADFSAGNLEGPTALGIDSHGRDHGDIGFVYDGEVYSGTNFLFNYHPRIFSDLKNSGFDMLTSANNHALDRESIGVDKTILASKAASLPTVGTRMSNEPTGLFYKIATINNIRVAYLGCTEMTNGNNDHDDQVLLCYSSRIINLIKSITARADVDALIVMPHWGTEYTHTPGSEQKSYARKYIEAGALAVIGSHPHVLQPWEKYTATDGRESLIIYSLGNFVAGQAGLDRRTGTVAYLGLSKTSNQKAKIFGAGYTPTYRTNSRINPVGSDGPSDVLKHVASMYGAKSRIGISDNLLTSLCTKK